MIRNFYPTPKQTDHLYKKHILGFTNGKSIYINLYTDSWKEKDIEKDLNIIYIHELIHLIDMDLSEEEVIFITEILYKHLR